MSNCKNVRGKWKYLLILFLLFIISGGLCHGQTKMEELGLKGKVKTVIEFEETELETHKLAYIKEYYFNSDGILVSEQIDTVEKSRRSIFKFIFYDEKERMLFYMLDRYKYDDINMMI